MLVLKQVLFVLKTVIENASLVFISSFCDVIRRDIMILTYFRPKGENGSLRIYLTVKQ